MKRTQIRQLRSCGSGKGCLKRTFGPIVGVDPKEQRSRWFSADVLPYCSRKQHRDLLTIFLDPLLDGAGRARRNVLRSNGRSASPNCVHATLPQAFMCCSSAHNGSTWLPKAPTLRRVRSGKLYFLDGVHPFICQTQHGPNMLTFMPPRNPNRRTDLVDKRNLQAVHRPD